MRVSVVIPAFNCEKLIPNAIVSVATQTFRDIEVIVVDDASSDATAAVAETELKKSGLKHKVIRLRTNGGPSAARNEGVRQARGEFVAFLDADDMWMPEKIQRQVAILETLPEVRLCGCQADWVDDKRRVVSPLFKGLPSLMPDGWKRLLWDCYVATPCAMARRADLGSRPFNESLRVAEDRDLWIRLARAGSVGLVQDVMVKIRTSPTSYMSRNISLTRTVAKPMILGYVRTFSRNLSLNEKRRIRGKLYCQIGKDMCADPQKYGRGAWYLLGAALLLDKPFDNLRYLFLSAPGIRDLKAVAKSFLQPAQPEDAAVQTGAEA